MSIEDRKAYRRKYYELNKEKELEACRTWNENNRERLHEVITCHCGGHYIFKDKARHMKSMRHQRHANIKPPEETLTVKPSIVIPKRIVVIL